MDGPMIYRSLVVSFIVAIVAAFFSMSVLTAPAEGEMMPDITRDASAALSRISEADMSANVQEIPLEKVTGLKRFSYPFSHPQVWSFFLQSVFTWFCGLFGATTIVSLWQRRAGNTPSR